MKLIFYLLFIVLFPLFASSNTIVHIQIHDAISPATAKYLDDAFLETKKNNATLLLIELDTPGGLATSMRHMIQEILNSEIPVVMFVSPKGSRAASAGTYLMYASHIAAMTPGSNIGAATPVNLMQAPEPKKDKNKDDKTQETIKQQKSAMEKKVINDSIAYIKSIAELRNRNIPWAIQAVKEGESISSKEALELNVIDLMAENIEDLLLKIDNREVLINEKKIRIQTSNTNLVFFAPSWKTKILMTISNPNIAYIFLIVAMYGILFEMMNPGSVFPGVIGAVSALIALYALNILPFNYVGLLLIFLGVTFMIMEIFVAGIGILGVAGVIAFAFGSLLLFDEKTLGLGVSYPLVFAFSFVSLGFFVYILGSLVKARQQKAVSGVENLLGTKGIIVEVKKEMYKVACNGELWNAKSSEAFELNDEVIIENINGLTVEIRSLK